MGKLIRALSRAPVVLYFLSPLVGEFFLGDFPIVLLPLIIVLALWYGAAALLIREVARRRNRGRPTIMGLALAWGVLGEGVLSESLFNPHYADQRVLDVAYIPVFGIGGTWTVMVLSLHVLWSISLPIAVVEFSRTSPTSPFLGRCGIVVSVVLLIAGAVITFATNYTMWGHFVAPWPRLVGAAGIFVVVTAAALLIPTREPAAHRPPPLPTLLFLLLLGFGVVFFAGLWLPPAAGIPAILVSLTCVGTALWSWAGSARWGTYHNARCPRGGAAQLRLVSTRPDVGKHSE